MLTIPPNARPYSDPKLLFTTRNSCTASWGGVARCTPLMLLTKSAPSTVISLLNERIPPKEICVTSNSVNVVPRLVLLVATPGVKSAKSVNRRVLVGRETICFSSITWLTSVRVGSITGASPVTTTVSPALTTCSVTLIVAVWPTFSAIPVCVNLPKPVYCTVRS